MENGRIFGSTDEVDENTSNTAKKSITLRFHPVEETLLQGVPRFLKGNFKDITNLLPYIVSERERHKQMGSIYSSTSHRALMLFPIQPHFSPTSQVNILFLSANQ